MYQLSKMFDHRANRTWQLFLKFTRSFLLDNPFLVFSTRATFELPWHLSTTMEFHSCISFSFQSFPTQTCQLADANSCFSLFNFCFGQSWHPSSALSWWQRATNCWRSHGVVVVVCLISATGPKCEFSYIGLERPFCWTFSEILLKVPACLNFCEIKERSKYREDRARWPTELKQNIAFSIGQCKRTEICLDFDLIWQNL